MPTLAPDLAGQKFGLWTALTRDPEKLSKWITRCECGSLSSVEGSTLTRGRSTKCASCAGRLSGGAKLKYDHAGETFGKLKVLSHVGSGSWNCICECGTEKVVTGGALRKGQRSCGCDIPTGRKGAGHPRFNVIEGEVSYSTAHQRVAAARGRARSHACLICSAPATSWAYRGGSPKELREWRETGAVKRGWLRYSPDPADYDPLCWSCHARKDVLEAKARTE